MSWPSGVFNMYITPCLELQSLCFDDPSYYDYFWSSILLGLWCQCSCFVSFEQQSLCSQGSISHLLRIPFLTQKLAIFFLLLTSTLSLYFLHFLIQESGSTPLRRFIIKSSTPQIRLFFVQIFFMITLCSASWYVMLWLCKPCLSNLASEWACNYYGMASQPYYF